MLHVVLLAEGVRVPTNLLTGSLREFTSLLRDVGLSSNLSDQSSILKGISSTDCQWSRPLVACMGNADLVWLLGMLVNYSGV